MSSILAQLNLERALGFNLHIAAFVLKQSLKAALKQAKIALTTEEAILLLLIPASGIEQTDLQQKVHKDKTNLTRLLDRLVDKGFVVRQPSQLSRRQQIVSATEAGVSMQANLGQLLQGFVADANQNISPQDQQTTVKTLQQLVKNLG